MVSFLAELPPPHDRSRGLRITMGAFRRSRKLLPTLDLCRILFSFLSPSYIQGNSIISPEFVAACLPPHIRVSAASMQETYIRGGLLCIVAFSALCVISLRPIRNNAYEIFFYTHLAMVM